MSVYNNIICLNNIYYLANLKRIKISKLEDDAGVSTGYLSRLKKDSAVSSPSININALCSFANSLEVPLDALIEFDLQLLTENELRLIRFLKKMIAQTADNKLNWDYDDADQFDSSNHPISVELGQFGGNYIHSGFTKKEEYVQDEIYWTHTDSSHSFYLLKLNNKPYNYELYLCIDGKEAKTVCSSNRANGDIFRQIMSDLYSLIHKKVREPQLDEETLETIDAFLKE